MSTIHLCCLYPAQAVPLNSPYKIVPYVHTMSNEKKSNSLMWLSPFFHNLFSMRRGVNRFGSFPLNLASTVTIHLLPPINMASLSANKPDGRQPSVCYLSFLQKTTKIRFISGADRSGPSCPLSILLSTCSRWTLSKNSRSIDVGGWALALDCGGDNLWTTRSPSCTWGISVRSSSKQYRPQSLICYIIWIGFVANFFYAGWAT
jgi:hypothetical protein